MGVRGCSIPLASPQPHSYLSSQSNFLFFSLLYSFLSQDSCLFILIDSLKRKTKVDFFVFLSSILLLFCFRFFTDRRDYMKPFNSVTVCPLSLLLLSSSSLLSITIIQLYFSTSLALFSLSFKFPLRSFNLIACLA